MWQSQFIWIFCYMNLWVFHLYVDTFIFHYSIFYEQHETFISVIFLEFGLSSQVRFHTSTVWLVFRYFMLVSMQLIDLILISQNRTIRWFAKVWKRSVGIYGLESTTKQNLSPSLISLCVQMRKSITYDSIEPQWNLLDCIIHILNGITDLWSVGLFW